MHLYSPRIACTACVESAYLAGLAQAFATSPPIGGSQPSCALPPKHPRAYLPSVHGSGALVAYPLLSGRTGRNGGSGRYPGAARSRGARAECSTGHPRCCVSGDESDGEGSSGNRQDIGYQARRARGQGWSCGSRRQTPAVRTPKRIGLEDAGSRQK